MPILSRALGALALLLTLPLLAACTTTQVGQDATDTFDAWNRPVHVVNETFDTYLLHPVSEVYRYGTPEPARDGLANALGNLREPLTFVNCLLQGDPGAALDTLGRFALNSTVGVGGLVQVTPAEGRRETRDFGQTLGRWGIHGGPYLVLPLLGPSSVRDFGGRAGDWFLDPVRAVQRHNDWDGARVARTGMAIVARRAARSDRQDASGRPDATDYESVRDAYLGRRLVHVHGPSRARASAPETKPADDAEDDAGE